MVFLLVIAGTGLRPEAQGPAPARRALSLSGAVDRALATNPTLVAARFGPLVETAALGVLREIPNPEFTTEFTKETPKQAYGVTLPIELGGKRGRRTAVGETAVEASQAALAATTARVSNDVRRAYFGLLVADARASLLRDLRTVAGRVVDSARQRFEAGSAPRLEVMQAQLALSSAENEATSALGDVAAATADLNVLLGEPLDTSWDLTTALDAASPATAAAMIDLASASSTELLLLDRRIDAQRARLALAGALRVPDLTPGASFTRDAAPEFDYGWRAGVSITLPVFTTHKAGVQLEQAALDQLLAERAATVQRITGQVTAAAAMVDAQRRRFQQYRDDIVPQAQQVEQVAQDSYDLGQTDIVALLQALRATFDVRLRALDAVDAFQRAVADLELAVGARLP